MIDKTQKRSLFVRIAFVLFAVALAFCSVSVALNEGKYKAEAFSVYSTGYDSSELYNGYVYRFMSDFLPAFRFSSNNPITFSDVVSNVYAINLSCSLTSSGSQATIGLNSNVSSSQPSTPTLSNGVFYYIAVGNTSSTNSTFFNTVYSNVGSSCFFNSEYGFAVPTVLSVSSEDISFSDLPEYVQNYTNASLYSSLSFYSVTYNLGSENHDPFYVTFSSVCPDSFSISDYDIGQFSVLPSNSSVTESVTDVWTSIFIWLTTSVNSLLGILYVNGELTILGVLVVMSLGISIFFLLLAVVSNFFHLRS